MIAHPDVSCITNVGTAHIGELGSRENILKAKLEITDGMKDQSTLTIFTHSSLLLYRQRKKSLIKDFLICSKSVSYTHLCSL